MQSYLTNHQIAEACYNKAEIGDMINSGLDSFYTKIQINDLLYGNYSTIVDRNLVLFLYSTINRISEAYYNKADTAIIVASNIYKSESSIISGDLSTWALRCSDFKLRYDGDNNCLRLRTPI